MELSALKRDLNLLLAVLGIKAAGTHLACPFHGSGQSFSVFPADDGVWIWKCNSSTCGTGTIIDAAMQRYRSNSVVDALKAIEADLGVNILRDEELIEPRVDVERATRLIEDAHANLLNSQELQDVFLTKKRGITLETVRKYKLGFAGDPDGKGWPMAGKNWKAFGWTIPITDANGALVFVKFHFERIPFPDGPKCMAAPFGTYPVRNVLKKIEPKHGTNTLWPAPETFCGVDRLFLAPGELKAMALISAGMAATSPTTGENKMLERHLERIVKAKPGAVFITFDDDAPKLINGKWVRKGCDWRDLMLEALSKRGVSAYAFSYGDDLPNGKTDTSVGTDKTVLVQNNEMALPAVQRAAVYDDPVAAARDQEWTWLEDKLVREAQARGESCTVAPEATKQDLKNLLALSKPVVREAYLTQEEILAKHGLVSPELSEQMPRFKRHKIGKCRS